MTYNVHRCFGVDGLLSPRRIAEVIAACEPDIVALQELDVGRLRTGGVDQAHAIATMLGMELHFHPAVKVMEELYGDAILTARPSRLVKAGALPGPARWPELEPRGALWAVIEMDGVELNVINTHLGLSRPDRRAQVEELLGPGWLGDARCQDPYILIGDFNAPPRSNAYRRLARELRDAQVVAGHRWPRATFPAYLPVLRLDHVFVSPSVEVLEATVVRSELARVASDHLPLTVDIRLRSGESG
jgi:endonuclease/exonuclease/phosphatase family metal-dependent hydrolase